MLFKFGNRARLDGKAENTPLTATEVSAVIALSVSGKGSENPQRRSRLFNRVSVVTELGIVPVIFVFAYRLM
jgi:hypothetical protein